MKRKTNTLLVIIALAASSLGYPGGAHRIIHQGVRYLERDKALPPTVVPPGAYVSDTILPSDYVSYESGRNAGWKVRDIFEGGIAHYAGHTIGIFLPIKIGGVVKNYQLTFKVEKDLMAAAKLDICSDELVRSPVNFGRWLGLPESNRGKTCEELCGAMHVQVGGTPSDLSLFATRP